MFIHVKDSQAARKAIEQMPAVAAALARVGLTVESVVEDENTLINAAQKAEDAAAQGRDDATATMKMAIESAGVKLGDDLSPTAVEKAIKARISISACEQLAATGVSSPVEDLPAVDPTAKPAANTSDKSGLDRIRARLGQ